MPSQAFSTLDTALSNGAPQLRQAVAQVVDLSGQIERGQAAMPLRDHFESLRSALGTAPFTIVLVGLDADSRAAALDWLCRDEGQAPQQNGSPLTPGLAEIHLNPIAPRGVQGVRLLVPESLHALVQSPALVARLRTEAHLIAVAGPAELELGIEEAAILKEFAADALATWVITCGTGCAPVLPASPAPPIRTAADQGWRAVLEGGTIPRVHLGKVHPTAGDPDVGDPAAVDSENGVPLPPVPAVMVESDSGVRGGLLGCQHARRFEGAFDMLEERIQQDVRQQTSRRQTLLRRSTVLGDTGNDRALRETTEGLRGEIGQRVAALNSELEENHRERMLPGAVSENRIKNFLEDVGAADLTHEGTGRVVHVSAGTDCLKRGEQLLHELLQAALHEDLARLAPELQSLTQHVATKLPGIDAQNIPPSQDRFDETSLWESIKKTIHLNPRYRGEIFEKAGAEAVFEWVMHGRRPMMLLTILASMGVPLLSELRARLAPVMIVIFAAGLIWARRSFREEKQEKVEREVIRLRDALEAEIRSTYEKTLRDWQARAVQQLREIEKVLLREMDERVKAWVASTGSRSVAERVELQTKLKAVENRLRELDGLFSQVGRIRQTAVGIRQTLEHETRSALNNLQHAARMT